MCLGQISRLNNIRDPNMSETLGEAQKNIVLYSVLVLEKKKNRNLNKNFENRVLSFNLCNTNQ